MKQYRIEEICEVISGGTPSTKVANYWNGDIIWLTPKDLSNTTTRWISRSSNKITKDGLNNSAARMLPINTVLLSSRAPIGYLALAGKQLCTNQGFKSMICNTNYILPEYLYYYLHTKVEELNNISTGSTFKELLSSLLKNYVVHIHDLTTQQHIVDILGTLDETIENNELLIQKIEEKILLEYDRINAFEPLSEIVMSDCFDITIGKTPPRKESHWFTKNSTDVKWLSISDLGKSSVFCFDTSERIIPEGISKYNVKVVPKNTVVLSFKLTVGKVAITGCDMATNEAIAHFNSSNHCLLEYLYCYLKRYNFDTLGNTSSIATAVNSKTIKAMHFFIPDDTMLENFHHKTFPLFENIRQLLIENQKLKELKQLYLKKFFG